MITLSWELILISVFASIFILIFLGLPVAVVLGLVGTLSSLLFLNKMGIVAYAAWQVCNSFILSAVPLFVFMGHLLLTSGLSDRLYEGGSHLVGRLPGGLLHVNIFTCALFASITGSSVATSATIGSMALPQMEKRDYDKKLTYGSLAAGGTLGLLIPPSTGMIIYCVVVDESVADLFMAGILPAAMIVFLYMFYIWLRVKISPKLAPPVEKKSGLDIAKSVFRMWPVLIIMVTILGGIYLGIMTPTEAAAVGASLALISGIISKKLTWRRLKETLIDSVLTSTQLLFIMIGASIISGTFGILRIPDHMASWVISLGLPNIIVMMVIYLMYCVLGCFIDTVSMMVLTLPVIFPLIVQLGYDPVWFGIIMIILVEMAMITPPLGLNVYVIHSLRPKESILKVFMGSLPFCLIMFFGILILTIFPTIVTWLPSTMRN